MNPGRRIPEDISKKPEDKSPADLLLGQSPEKSKTVVGNGRHSDERKLCIVYSVLQKIATQSNNSREGIILFFLRWAGVGKGGKSGGPIDHSIKASSFSPIPQNTHLLIGSKNFSKRVEVL
jgi:hypothetical protein